MKVAVNYRVPYADTIHACLDRKGRPVRVPEQIKNLSD